MKFQCWKCGGLIFGTLCKRCGAVNAIKDQAPGRTIPSTIDLEQK
jgi:hypothetical protein